MGVLYTRVRETLTLVRGLDLLLAENTSRGVRAVGRPEGREICMDRAGPMARGVMCCT